MNTELVFAMKKFYIKINYRKNSDVPLWRRTEKPSCVASVHSVLIVPQTHLWLVLVRLLASNANQAHQESLDQGRI